MQFTMSFDWNVTRLEQQKQVLVHQEVSIPKQSELDSKSYVGTVNGTDVTKNLMLDDSNSTKNVIHFMLPKPAVMQIAEQVNKNGQSAEGLMAFTLEPSTTSSSSAVASNHTMMMS